MPGNLARLKKLNYLVSGDCAFTGIVKSPFFSCNLDLSTTPSTPTVLLYHLREKVTRAGSALERLLADLPSECGIP